MPTAIEWRVSGARTSGSCLFVSNTGGAAALAELAAARAILNTEIGNYLVPIAGCDEQFNGLLEEHRRIDSAIETLSIGAESETA